MLRRGDFDRLAASGQARLHREIEARQLKFNLTEERPRRKSGRG